MQLVMIAIPTAACALAVIENEYDEEAVANTQCWFDEIVPTVYQLTNDCDIEKVLIFGPIDYTTKIKEMIEPTISNIELEEM